MVILLRNTASLQFARQLDYPKYLNSPMRPWPPLSCGTNLGSLFLKGPARAMPNPPSISELIASYSHGGRELRFAVNGMSVDELHARPIAGKWSTHEVICHLSDAEALYADRIKRVLAENSPTLMGMDPDLHVPRLAIRERNVEEELNLIELIRSQMTRILSTLRPEEFQRVGMHTEAGPLTLETLLSRVAGHIPHHVKHIAEKRAALGSK